MPVMEGRSAAAAGRISSADMSTRLFFLSPKEKPRPLKAGARTIRRSLRSVALAEQLQQQREQVDEVQVQQQRTGDRRAFRYNAALRGVAVDVVVLQPLGIVGGEASKHQDADYR